MFENCNSIYESLHFNEHKHVVELLSKTINLNGEDTFGWTQCINAYINGRKDVAM